MNEEAVKYGYELFTNDGYEGSIEEYKSLVASDPEALNYSYELFKNDGYKDSIDDLKSLIVSPTTGKTTAGSTESPLDSAQKPGDLVTQKDSTENVSESPIQSVEQVLEPNEPIVKLYDDYKKSGVLNIEEQNNIRKTILSQKEGKRSIWEKAEAFTEGWLRTGMPIPLYKYDTEEGLKEKREYAKKSKFLESLPDEKRQEINSYAVNRTLELSEESKNTLAENTILEEKSKSLVKQAKHLLDAVQQLKANGKSIPQDLVLDYKGKVDEIETISSRYNSNIDVLESNNEDIGSFGEELDLLKRNYTGVGYYKDLARLTTADMISGVMEFGLSTAELAPINPAVAGGATMEFPEAKKFIADFRDESNRQRETIKPVMSVQDINSGADFGKWLAEQTAVQLPVMATLVASGGSTGLGLLSASAGGTKMGELEDSNRLHGTEYGQSEIYLAGAGNALTEFLSETVSLGILSKGKRALKTVGKAELKKGIAEYASLSVKGISAAGIDAGKEGLSEFANTLSQNMIDILYLGKNDTHVFDGAIDALASGSAMGFGMSIAPTAIGMGSKAFTDTTVQKLLADNSRQIEGLTQELELGAETLNQSTKDILTKKVSKLVNEQDAILKKAFLKVSNMERSDIGALIKLDAKANKIMKAYNDVSSSEMSAGVKASLLKDLKVENDRVVKKKLELLDKKPNGNKVKDTSKESKETSSTEEGGGTNGTTKGGESVQGETSTKSSVAEPSNGVQPSKPGDKGAKPDGNVGEVVRDARRWSWKSLDKQPAVKLETRLSETKSQLEKAEEIDKPKLQDRITAIEEQLSKINEEQVSENRADEITAGDISDINLSEKLGIDKVSDFLDKADKALKESTKDTLGINLPVAVAQGAIQVMKAATATAKTGADVISAGINYMRNTDWYKNLNDKDKQDAENDFLNNVQNAKDEAEENSTLGQRIKGAFKDVDAKTEWKKMRSGMPLMTYIDGKVFEPAWNKLETLIAKETSKQLTSENKIKRQVAQALTSWYNGLPRTDEQLFERRAVSGRQELAYIKGAKMTSQLQALINGDKESAKRVHSALDPEVYLEDERVDYDDLEPNEKQLFDELREINRQTHEANYEMGFISEETYEKYKDGYIGRGYEAYENIEGRNLEDKENFLNNKIFTDMFKQRKEIDEWKIENTVKDPIYLTINRMIHTERNASVKAYSEYISRNVDLVSTTAKPGFTKLVGKAYGELNGKHVVNYIAEDFKGYFYSNSALESMYVAFQAYDKNQIRQFYKKFHTVFSPAVQVGNWISNHAFAAAAGVNVRGLWSNYGSASKDIKAKEGDYLKLVEAGVLGTDVLTQDLTLSEGKPEGLKIGTKEFDNWVGRNLNKADKWAQERYSRSDDVMKLSAYKALRASGLTEKEAIQRVFEGFQNYATVGKMWDTAAKTPLIGNAYIKFQADLQRIMKNSVAKRPLTTATMLAGIKMMAYATSVLLAGENDEEREIREGRPFIPKINIGFTEVPLTFAIGGGKEVNLARYISPFYSYDIPNESWQETLTSFMPYQIKTGDTGTGEEFQGFDTPDVLIGSTWSAFMANQDFRGKTITDPNANKYVPSGLSKSEKLANQFNYVLRSQFPLYSMARDGYSAYTEGEDFYGRDKSLMDILVSVGIKIQTYDDKSYDKSIQSAVNSIEYKSKNIKDKMNGVKNRLKKDVEKLQKRLDEGKIDQNQFDEAFKEKFNTSMSRIEAQMSKLVEQQSKLNNVINKAQTYLDKKQKKGGN